MQPLKLCRQSIKSLYYIDAKMFRFDYFFYFIFFEKVRVYFELSKPTKYVFDDDDDDDNDIM